MQTGAKRKGSGASPRHTAPVGQPVELPLLAAQRPHKTLIYAELTLLGNLSGSSAIMKPSQVVRGKTALDFAFDIAFSEEEKTA